jgi:hypothetical protein
MVGLQSLDSIGQAVLSLAGEEVPKEYEDAAKILFALVTALYAFIAARVETLSKS